MTRPTLAVLALALLAAPPSFGGPPYNEIQQKSSHNSYQRFEALLDQITYHRVHSLELDLHNSKGGLNPPIFGDWYVYHTTIPGDSDTTCRLLSDCLKELQTYHRQTPNHEVLTIFVDIKDFWNDGTGQSPALWDSMVRSYFSDSDLYSPQDLFNRCPGSLTLQDTVVNCGWPDIDEMRGQILWALTDGTLEPGTRLDTYRDHSSNRVAFGAGGIDAVFEIWEYDQIFFNLNEEKDDLPHEILDAGFVVRQYNLNGAGEYSQGQVNRVNHLGTNAVNLHEDPWSITHNDSGWPFTCLDQNCGSNREAENIVGVEVDSGDIWNSSDDFYFRYQTPSGSGTWRAAINTVNSHVEDFAKGCLMARATLADDSPYMAVCRPADNKQLRVQYRDSFGGGSSAEEADIVPANTIDPESLTEVRLELSSDNFCARGYGSQDGTSWTPITNTRCFNDRLEYQGVATSSHDDGLVKFLYKNLTYNGASRTNADFSGRWIGEVRAASSFDGPFDDGGGCRTTLRLRDATVLPGQDLEFEVSLLHRRPETVDAGFDVIIETLDGHEVTRRSAAEQRWALGDERTTVQSWRVPPSAPPGVYRLRISIDRMLQGRVFEEALFEVVSPADGPYSSVSVTAVP